MSTWGLWFNVPQDSLQHTVLPCSPPSGVIAPKDRGETLHESNGNKKSKYGLWEQILQELWPHAHTHTPPFPGLGIAVPKQSWAANLENAEHKGKGLSNTFRNNAVCFVSFVWNSVESRAREQHDAPQQGFLLRGRTGSRRPAGTLEIVCVVVADHTQTGIWSYAKSSAEDIWYVFGENTKQTPSLVWSFGLTTSY